jgi:hypothetical protein
MTQGPYSHLGPVKAAERMRAQAQGELLLRTTSAVTPSRGTLKGLGMACALAAGAFGLTMLKDPPRSVAADPTAPVAKSADVRVPTGIPVLDCITSTTFCP